MLLSLPIRSHEFFSSTTTFTLFVGDDLDITSDDDVSVLGFKRRDPSRLESSGLPEGLDTHLADGKGLAFFDDVHVYRVKGVEILPDA